MQLFSFIRDEILENCVVVSVMDWTSVRQGKETWLQPSRELQDKTKQDRTILENSELY
jgi:hypothetical protein